MCKIKWTLLLIIFNQVLAINKSILICDTSNPSLSELLLCKFTAHQFSLWLGRFGNKRSSGHRVMVIDHQASGLINSDLAFQTDSHDTIIIMGNK